MYARLRRLLSDNPVDQIDYILQGFDLNAFVRQLDLEFVFKIEHELDY